jgi:NAD(P)H-hydrate epimerase
MDDIDLRLYSAAAVKALERRAVEQQGIDSYTLMRRAATAAWRAARARWPERGRVGVVCGGGNNGGDGWVLARLAVEAGCEVVVLDVAGRKAQGDAERARVECLQTVGDRIQLFSGAAEAGPVLGRCGLVVDAIFGTGLSRAPTGDAALAIAAIAAAHAAGAKVLAIDLPSGLAADTGAVFGAAVAADLTVSFVGRKPGLHTGRGPELCGEVVFERLEIDAGCYEDVEVRARLTDRAELAAWLPRRPRGAHKGDHGHVLLIGGDHGMPGAILLAARAALRAGAGLVSVATRAAHAALLVAAQPELMVRGVESAADLAGLIAKADVIAIGPGLGQDDWGRAMADTAFAAAQPLVVDADALNLLAVRPRHRGNWILTPHPGEAGRLLGCGTAEVQADRFTAVAALRARFGGVAVLKGAGSLIAGEQIQVCPYGNPGMGVGGMGDVLTGIVAALLGQGLELECAAAAAVTVHALAGDQAASAGERGLLPKDLIGALRGVVNP